jgi:hypothetical protein
LKEVQVSFYRACQAAEEQLTSGAPPQDDGPAGQPLSQWLEDLLEQNRQLAQTQQWEEVRAAAEEQARNPLPGGRPESGLATYWQASSGVPALRLWLTSAEAASLPQTVLASLGWLLLLSGMWALSSFPRVLTWVRFFWPEQLAGLGLICGQFHGLAYILVLLGIGSRLVYVAVWLSEWSRRPAAVPPSEV